MIRTPDLTLALCAEVDPEIFFPKIGENAAQAKAICARCPIREACADYAISNGFDHGIWGGLSPNERRAASPPPNPRKQLATRIHELRRHGTTVRDITDRLGITNRQYYRLLADYPMETTNA